MLPFLVRTGLNPLMLCFHLDVLLFQLSDQDHTFRISFQHALSDQLRQQLVIIIFFLLSSLDFNRFLSSRLILRLVLLGYWLLLLVQRRGVKRDYHSAVAVRLVRIHFEDGSVQFWEYVFHFVKARFLCWRKRKVFVSFSSSIC